MNGKKIAIIVAVIVILGVGGVAAYRAYYPNPSATSDTASVVGTMITYTDNGFSPSSLTIKAGEKLTIKNTSSHDMQFDSDPHPTHTSDTEINAGAIAPGQERSATVDKKGTFGYHNHLDPSERGTLIVE